MPIAREVPADNVPHRVDRGGVRVLYASEGELQVGILAFGVALKALRMSQSIRVRANDVAAFVDGRRRAPLCTREGHVQCGVLAFRTSEKPLSRPIPADDLAETIDVRHLGALGMGAFDRAECAVVIENALYGPAWDEPDADHVPLVIDGLGPVLSRRG
jgi:hypothetical protein